MANDKSRYPQNKMKNVVPLGTGLIKTAVTATEKRKLRMKCAEKGGSWVNGKCSL